MYPAEPTPGMLVTPKLRLVRPLGEGGMGAVWVADHLALNTQVVVKFVSDKLVWSSEAVGRFAREAAAASQVKSPHVVQMLDYGVTETGIPYIVMEFLEGHDLADHLTPGGLPAREVVPIVSQLSRALSRAHERGIVHRDIKPSNVFLCEMGGGELFVKLLDFGVAKHDASTKPGEETRTGTLIGSPFYMSPEQLMGEKGIDFRSDLWSLGVLTFEALTGARPFNAETVGALTMQVHTEPLPRPSQRNPALPPAIDEWFFKACARDPAARFRGAKELAQALARALDEDVPRNIELERSEPGREAEGFADTAEAPSGDLLPSGSGGGRASGPSGSKRGGSAPPQMSATGAGLWTTGGSRKEASRKPLFVAGGGALVVLVVAALGAFHRRDEAPPAGGLASVASSGLPASTASIASSVPVARPGAPVDAAAAPVSVAVQTPLVSSAVAPASAGIFRRRAGGAPSASVRAAASITPVPSSPAPPQPAAAASVARPEGNADDIR